MSSDVSLGQLMILPCFVNKALVIKSYCRGCLNVIWATDFRVLFSAFVFLSLLVFGNYFE